MEISGKKISIIGAVRSGISAAKLAKSKGAIPFVSDSGSKEKLQDAISVFNADGIVYEIGTHSEKVYNCDLMITSPGVPTNSEILTNARKRNIKIISELEFASLFCKGTIIAITGTNGKTTTTALMNYTINECGRKCYTAGNIGEAFSEITDKIKEDEFVALEVSSFQLDFISQFKPHFSMILNITPDHMDRYNNNFEEYIAAKLKITQNLDENDFFIYNADDKVIKSHLIDKKKFQILAFSLSDEIPAGTYFREGKMFYSKSGNISEVCSSKDLFIRGEHNIANALAVLSVAKLINLPDEKIKRAFSTFKGVEHRIEFVKEINGVEYFNDSKATNVDSVWYALRSFDKPLYLILGGKDKGNNYDQIKELVKTHVVKIYAIGSSAQKVYDYFNRIVKTEKKDSLEACVNAAYDEAEKGSILLLSPACASFDMFDNYEHRGKVFKQAVNNLIK